MRIAIHLGIFPKLSETFILNQIVGMVEQGHKVQIAARERGGGEPVQEAVTERGLLDATRYRRPVPTKILSRIRTIKGVVSERDTDLSVRLRMAIHSFPATTRGMNWIGEYELHRSGEFDVVQCHFGWIGALTARLADMKVFQTPFIVSFHGVDLHESVSSSRYRLVWRHAAAITCNSKFMARRAVELGCPSKKIRILPESVDTERFRPLTTANRGPKLRIITVARLTRAKGIDVAIRALALLGGAARDVEYHIVGDGPERLTLEALVQEFKLTEVVRFHGACASSMVLEELQRSDIFVLPSRLGENGLEGQGVVLQEAQAVGVPVIAADVGGVSEGIAIERSGFLFPQNDSAALAKYLKLLLAAEPRRSEMGSYARKFVLERFSTKVLNGQLEALCEEVRRR